MVGSARHCEHFRSGVDPLPTSGRRHEGRGAFADTLSHTRRTLDVAHGDFIQGGTLLLSRLSFFRNCAMDG